MWCVCPSHFFGELVYYHVAAKQEILDKLIDELIPNFDFFTWAHCTLSMIWLSFDALYPL